MCGGWKAMGNLHTFPILLKKKSIKIICVSGLNSMLKC